MCFNQCLNAYGYMYIANNVHVHDCVVMADVLEVGVKGLIIVPFTTQRNTHFHAEHDYCSHCLSMFPAGSISNRVH